MLSQVLAGAAVVFFLAAVITAMVGSEIAGGLAGAWEHGQAQAAAERRRLGAVAREVRDRNSGGRGLSGLISRVRETGRGMRGPRHEAAAGRVPGSSGPFRRIGNAATVGARAGARVAAAAAAIRRRAAQSRDRTRPVGARPSRQPRSRRHLGVCDRCGATVARLSLTPIPGIRELWCRLCAGSHAPRTEAETRPQPSGQSPAPVAPAPVSVPLTAGAAPELALSRAPITPGSPIPAPATATAVAEGRAPAMTAAAAAITPSGGTMPRQISAGGYTRPGAGLATRGGVIEGRVAGRPPAIRGDAADHGEWVENAKLVIKYLSDLFAFVKVMTEDMGKGECPAGAIDETAAWAEMIYAYGTQILRELVQIDQKIKPWIDAVWAQGGPQNVASPRWLEGRSRRQLQGR
jgi:hypothetical protein